MLKPWRNSIRNKLFISISVVIIVSLLLIALLGFFGTRKEIQQMLDANMAKAGKLILALIYHEIEEGEGSGFLDDFNEKINKKIIHKYENTIHIQVWHEGELVYLSDNKFTIERPAEDGFEDVRIDSERWRRFSLNDEENDISVSILEQYEIRNELIWKILASPFIPLAISSLMIFLIWFFIDQKLGALNQLSRRIAELSPNALTPFDASVVPSEIQPLVVSVNMMIKRVANSVEAERRFTDNAAHELRTPLAVIKTHVQLLMKNNEGSANEELLHDLENAVDRLIHLINQVLVLARLEPESENFNKEQISLEQIIKKEIDNQKQALAEKNLEIEFLVKEQIGCFCNKIYFEILLRNLLDNAVKYSFEGSKITVELDTSKGEKFLRISNFGKEILPRQLEKLFDPFYRMRGEHIIGSGLGLAIAKKIAELHSAKIKFTSQKVDEEKALNSVEISF